VGDAVAPANVEASYSPWFDTVTYSGAFAPDVDSWLDGWSYLDCVQGVLAGGSLDCTDPNALSGLPFKNCDGTWQLAACTETPAAEPADATPAPAPAATSAGTVASAVVGLVATSAVVALQLW
jgi:hypothetical protein